MSLKDEISGPFKYSDIPNLKKEPGDFSSFQPTLEKDVFLLTASNVVLPIIFEKNTIQIAEKRQIILEEKGNIWGAKEIADGTVAVGYNNMAEVNIYVDSKVTRTFTMPNVEAFGFILLPDWDPLWSPKIS